MSLHTHSRKLTPHAPSAGCGQTPKRPHNLAPPYDAHPGSGSDERDRLCRPQDRGYLRPPIAFGCHLPVGDCEESAVPESVVRGARPGKSRIGHESSLRDRAAFRFAPPGHREFRPCESRISAPPNLHQKFSKARPGSIERKPNKKDSKEKQSEMEVTIEASAMPMDQIKLRKPMRRQLTAKSGIF